MTMVNKNKLWRYLEEISGIDIKTFDDRKKLRKTVYFIQKLGLNMGYKFGWYIHGPYSSDLTKDAFEYYNQKETLDTTESPEILPSEKEILVKIKNFFGDSKDDPEILEILASLDFIQNTAYIPDVEEKNKDVVITQLRKLKPNKFKNQDIESSWNKLAQYELV